MKKITAITKARSRVLLRHPFFGSIAMRLQPVADPKAEKFWTDGLRVGYNPDWIETAKPDEAVLGLAKAALHTGLGHTLRMGNRQPEPWRQACDHVVWNLLASADLPVPVEQRDAAQVFADKSVEQVYQILISLPKPKQDNGRSPQGGGQGGQGGSNPNQPGGNRQDQQNASENGLQTGGGSGLCEVRSTPAPDTDDAPTLTEQDADSMLAQAAAMAKSCGKAPPGALQQLIVERLKPTVDWRRELRDHISKAAKIDYTWSKPNRRHIWRGLYLPSLGGEETGKIVVMVDLSSSISRAEERRFLSELETIREDIQPQETVIIPFTSSADDVRVLQADEPLVAYWQRGGGTNFAAPFEAMARQDAGQPADAVVVLTDMCCSSYADDPRVPVLWASTGPLDPDSKPPYGRVVSMHDEARR